MINTFTTLRQRIIDELFLSWLYYKVELMDTYTYPEDCFVTETMKLRVAFLELGMALLGFTIKPEDRP